MNKNNTVLCPNCKTPVDVQDILKHQLEDQIKKKYQEELQKQQQNFNQQREQLAKAEQEFNDKRAKQNEIFKQELEKKLKAEILNKEQQLKAKLEEQNEEQIQLLKTQISEQNNKVKELNAAKIEVEKLKREKELAKEEAELKAQQMLSKQLQEEKLRIKKSVMEEKELQMRELMKQLEDQKKLTEEMKRKQEQGSMQLQGEVQELAIEEWLMSQFPLDTISEIKKGARGGDCLQVVNTRTRQNCGTIYYESKRTKDFQPTWIEKFKKDIRDKGATIGVLVTEVMPSGMERMGLRDGIWICKFDEFKGLCAVLRESVVQLSSAVASQENKGDKMSLLYDFLTSNTFKMQVEAIVEGFTSMKTALDKEKNAMQRIWKEREKQIDKVVVNTIDMYGSIKGIAGSAIQEVKSLDL